MENDDSIAAVVAVHSWSLVALDIVVPLACSLLRCAGDCAMCVA